MGLDRTGLDWLGLGTTACLGIELEGGETDEPRIKIVLISQVIVFCCCFGLCCFVWLCVNDI